MPSQPTDAKHSPSTPQYQRIGKLKVANAFYDFINQEVLPGLEINLQKFWPQFVEYLLEFTPQNRALLQTRDSLQLQINDYHSKHQSIDAQHYQQFLTQIGYLEPEPGASDISVQNVDAELSTLAGPQLVVPMMNARYSLNAANARWGSLYDALYGTDLIPDTPELSRDGGYNPHRGDEVIGQAKRLLDQHFPLQTGSHQDAISYSILDDKLQVGFVDGSFSALSKVEQCLGFTGDAQQPKTLLLRNNGLHWELQFDAQGLIGQGDSAFINDMLLESALTSIMDCEDSIAAVDTQDKIAVYRNWLGLMKGNLSEQVDKNGRSFTRSLNPDREYLGLNGERIALSGRALMFVRNVGHLMDTDLVLDDQGREFPEGLIDAVVTAMIGKHDLLGNSPFRNSKTGSIYIVKPKMHGPSEVEFSNQVFARVEQIIGLKPYSVKLGIMDEERRTSLNLRACIQAAKERVVFINTGFLDRTGDELHTSMFAGPMARKGDIKDSVWIKAYELSNVAQGLACGLSGKAQIGKGMWPKPDNMSEMMAAKIAHPQSGANTAWVPSPTAATLHALHYHLVKVADVQSQLKQSLEAKTDVFTDYRQQLLVPPLAQHCDWTDQQLDDELDNNTQGILGYVVRWVEQGVGCSKVPDINGVGLMEDRATLRISSQHVANWLQHQVVSKARVVASFQRSAKLVDQQNRTDSAYHAMGPNLEQSMAYLAALDLVFKGCTQPSGYTEPLLHAWRRKFKAKQQQRQSSAELVS
ncbi:malate synthase G [Alginatibacterium sediminis]|uniref:Malate synthase G n=1 Tax=Alginatibacterium sediminis TaxID=2164068 RepID=A0A420E664_9ALTE|nr:malate synthase G [Alginatibacterium sediminis]RKF12835.1 malate synthase G [Alginatibacterium sediminis]